MYKVLNDVFFDEFDKPHKKKIFYGGAGSGKSISIAQHFCLGLISGDKVRRLILRKYLPSLKVSVYLVIKMILDDWGIKYKENKTDHYFQVENNYLFYMGLDDPEKVKGGEFKEIWMEEATDFTEEDYKQLTIRLARDKYSEDATIFMSFNPIQAEHWCVKLVDFGKAHPEDYLVHHSTYKDNASNLSKKFMEELEGYLETDENYYRVYAKGEPGIIKGRIYSHFSIEDSSKWPWAQLNESLHCYGLDFGFNHPMCLTEVWYYEGEFYVKERYYKSEHTTDDLTIWMHKNKISHTDYIFADAAEPDRIQTLNTSRHVTGKDDDGEEVSAFVDRYNVYEAKKDVKAGIDFVKSKKIHLCAESVNLIKEYQNYRYKQTVDGQPIEEPVKIKDDGMDSLRYALYSLNIYLHLTPPPKLAKGSSYATTLFKSTHPYKNMGVDTVIDPY